LTLRGHIGDAYRVVIGSFADRETERIFAGERSRKFPADIQTTAHRRLLALEAAIRIDDLRSPPGNRLEALTGSRRGQHSIRVNSQWRICFTWEGAYAHGAELVDYH
jgi:proteic killer suppression protein